jgi:hypothetical protein
MSSESEFAAFSIERTESDADFPWRIVFTDFAQTAKTFEKFCEYDWDQDGYGWYGVVEALIHLKAPELADTLDFDPKESRLVIRSREQVALAQIAELMTEAVNDPSLLKAAIAAHLVLEKHRFRCPMHGAAFILADGFESAVEITFEAEWIAAQSRVPFSIGLTASLTQTGWFNIPTKIIYCPECQQEFEHACRALRRE